MRKQMWIVMIAIFTCTAAFAGCQRVAKVVSPAVQEVEPAEPVSPEPVVETTPEPVVEATPEPMPVVEATPEPVEEVAPEPVVETTPEPVKEVIEGTVVRVMPAQITSPAVGGQLQVSIQVAQAADVTGYEFTVMFDPTALRYVSSANADYLPAGAFEVPTVAAENSVYMAAASLGAPVVASSGTLATLTFEVVSAKASTLTLSEVTLTDSNVQEITLTSVNAEISAP